MSQHIGEQNLNALSRDDRSWIFKYLSVSTRRMLINDVHLVLTSCTFILKSWLSCCESADGLYEQAAAGTNDSRVRHFGTIFESCRFGLDLGPSVR